MNNFSFLPQNNGTVEVIVKYNGDISAVARTLGGTAAVVSSSYAILTLDASRVSELFNYEEVEFIEPDKRLFFQLRQELGDACITPVNTPTGLGLDGEGVAIAVIDSGIDYTHPDFRNPDGSSRIAFLWDQTLSGNPPEGFFKGSVFTRAEINAALNAPEPYVVIASTDSLGHGTAVAGIAAGNGASSNGNEAGVAPASTLIVVKLDERGSEGGAQSTDIMRALRFSFDRARELGLPLSVNLSYGTNNGPHDSSSLFEGFIDDISGEWKAAVTVAVGNEGAADHHYSAILSAGIEEYIDFNVFAPSLFLFIRKNFVDDISFELFSPSGASSGVLSLGGETITRRLDGYDVGLLYGEPTALSASQEIYVIMNGSVGSVRGLWRLRVTPRRIVNGRIDAWLPTTGSIGGDTAFLIPDPELTITIPSTARRVISVGVYDIVTDSPAVFTGRGGAYPYGKPDILAPAVSVLTTSPGGGYSPQSGTSIAAPFVTGSAALMLQWGIVQNNDPFLYGERIKAYLRKGADRSSPGRYPNNIEGYGRLDLCRVFIELLASKGGVL